MLCNDLSHVCSILGCQLHSLVPYPLCSGAGGSEGNRLYGYLQGAISAGGLEENDQEAARGEIRYWQEQVVLHTTQGMFILLLVTTNYGLIDRGLISSSEPDRLGWLPLFLPLSW